MKYGELNRYVCWHLFAQAKKMEAIENSVHLLDLKKAYVQVYIYKLLWSFHTVLLRGYRYCVPYMLDFKLNVVTLIMQSIIDALFQDESLSNMTHQHTSMTFSLTKAKFQ